MHRVTFCTVFCKRAGEPQDPQTEHQRSRFIHGQLCHIDTFVSSFAS